MEFDKISTINSEYNEEFKRIIKRSKIYISLYYKNTGSRIPGEWFDEYLLYLKNIERAYENTLFVPGDDDTNITFSGLRPTDEKTLSESYAKAKEEEEKLKKRFSEEEKDTKTIINEFLTKHKNLTEWSDPSFIELLIDYMDKRHMTDPELYNLALMDRRVFNNIINGRSKPSRNNAIRLALALRLDIKETDSLLDVAKRDRLSKVTLHDAIIRYCIEDKIFNVDTVNALLEQYGEEPLVNYEGYKMSYPVLILKAPTPDLIIEELKLLVEDFNELIFMDTDKTEIGIEDAMRIMGSKEKKEKIYIVFKSKKKAKIFYSFLKKYDIAAKLAF